MPTKKIDPEVKNRVQKEIDKQDKKLVFIKKRSQDSPRLENFKKQIMNVQEGNLNQFTMTLPLKWIRSQGILKGDELLLITNEYDPSVMVVVEEKAYNKNVEYQGLIGQMMTQFGDVLGTKAEIALRLEAQKLKKKWQFLANQQKAHNEKRKVAFQSGGCGP